MTTDHPMSWPALLALGAGHGVNPAMGWLFAVALGLQRGSRGAVWRALGPLAAGHALAIASSLLIALMLGLILPLDLLRWVTALLLVGVGCYRLFRTRHPGLGAARTFGGMQVNGRELAIWSFLMASLHGAGIMVLPLMLGSLPGAIHSHHVAQASIMSLGTLEWSGAAAALVHTAGYLLVTASIAVIVYEKVGVRFLRTTWVNLDFMWAVALVIAGVGTMLS